jgi:Amt family ammonium transporter
MRWITAVAALATLFLAMPGYAAPAEKKPAPAAASVSDKKPPNPADALKEELQTKFEAQDKTLLELRDSLDKLQQETRANAQSIEDLKTKLEENSIKVYEHLSKRMEGAEQLETLTARLKEMDAKAGGYASRRVPGQRSRGAVANAPPAAEKAQPEAGEAAVKSGSGQAAAPDARSEAMPPSPNPDNAAPATAPSANGKPAAQPADAAAETAQPAPQPVPRAATAGDGGSEPWVEPIGSIFAALLIFAGPLGFTLLEGARLESWALAPAALRNLLVWSVMFLAYFLVGYGIMFGVPDADWFAPFARVPGPEAGGAESFRLYQLGMAAMFGLIVAALLSDRLSLPAYLFLAFVSGAAVYPMPGHWIWSGQLLPDNKGWLEEKGFADFAGGAALDSAAAWFALAWAWKFPETRGFEANGENASQHPALGILAIFILCLCWLGMAGGRPGPEDRHVALLAVNVVLAVAAAVAACFAYSLTPWRKPGDPDAYGATVAGALAGLAAVSASIDALAPIEALLVGAVAGLLQPRAYRLLTRHILPNDCIAASLIAALGVGGVWGTLCVSLFGTDGLFAMPDWASLKIQALGALSVLAFSLAAGFLSAWGLEIWRGVSGLFGGGSGHR